MGNWCCGFHNNSNNKSSSSSSSSMVWATDDDDDWADSLAEFVSKNKNAACIPNNNKACILQVEKQRLLDGLDHEDQNNEFSPSSSSGNSSQSNHREVKIKISRKQLQELLGTRVDDLHTIPMDLHTIPMDDHVILSRLLKFGATTRQKNQMNNHLHDQQPSANWSWKPLLQTIPEHP